MVETDDEILKEAEAFFERLGWSHPRMPSLIPPDGKVLQGRRTHSSLVHGTGLKGQEATPHDLRDETYEFKSPKGI